MPTQRRTDRGRIIDGTVAHGARARLAGRAARSCLALVMLVGLALTAPGAVAVGASGAPTAAAAPDPAAVAPAKERRRRVARAVRSPKDEQKAGVGGTSTQQDPQTGTTAERIAVDDEAATTAGVPVTIAVLENDLVAPGAQPTLVEDAAPAGGTVTVDELGTLTYASAAGFVGVDTFGYAVADADGHLHRATVTVTVEAPAGAPAAPPLAPPAAPPVDDAAHPAPQDPTPVQPVVDADADAGGADLDAAGPPPPPPTPVRLVVPPPAPAPVQAPTPPAPVPPAPVRSSVDPARTAAVVSAVPDARDDTATTTTGTPVKISVGANDSDPDGDALVLGIAMAPANGTVTVNADGTITYTPNAGFVGTDSFTYTAADPSGAADTGTVQVTVGGTSRPPVPTGPTELNVVFGGTLSPVTATDPEGQPLVFSLVSGVLPFGVTLLPGGTFSGTALTPGVYVATIRICDPGSCIDRTYTYTVTGVGSAPPPASSSSSSAAARPLAVTGATTLPFLAAGLVSLLVGLCLVAAGDRRRTVLLTAP